MVETHALYRSVCEKISKSAESSTLPLNSHNCSETYTKTETQSPIFYCYLRAKKNVTFSMAIGNEELVYECCPEHLRMEIARIKE